MTRSPIPARTCTRTTRPSRFLQLAATTLATLCLLQCAASAATYKPGFTWFWESDFTVFDPTPSDYGSMTIGKNIPLCEGTPTEDVWAYLSIFRRDKFPESSDDKDIVMSRFAPYLTNKGHAWQPPDGQSPAAGCDTGPVFHYMPENHYRHFLKPTRTTPDRPTVALRWTSPVSGIFSIKAVFLQPLMPDPTSTRASADGAMAYVAKNDKLLAGPAAVKRPVPREINLDAVQLRKGDKMYFALSARGTAYCDETILDLAITYTSPSNDADVPE